MTRALLLAVLAAPALAAAQTMSPGTVLFTDGTSDRVRGPFISLAECEDPLSTVNLSWSTQLVEGGAFTPGATYQVYASNRQATGLTCITASNPATDTIAGPVGPPIAGLGPEATLLSFPAAAFVVAAGLGCDVVADAPIYVCVQAYSGGAAVGFAKGTLTLSVARPGAPTGVTVEPMDGALGISWTGPSGDPPAYDYVVVASSDPAVDPNVHTLVTGPLAAILGCSMTGLLNGATYDVRIYARSRAGNESAPSASVAGTPVGGAGARPAVARPDGFGQGRCGMAGGGWFAALAVSAMLARLRRRPGR